MSELSGNHKDLTVGQKGLAHEFRQLISFIATAMIPINYLLRTVLTSARLFLLSVKLLFVFDTLFLKSFNTR